MNDLDLIRAVAQKDNNAFRMLVNRHQQKVVSLAYNFTRNRQDAEDIAQDVFFTIWKKARKFKGDSALSTWIHRITVNTSLNFLRKHKRERSDYGDEMLALEAAPGSSSPEKALESEQNKRILYEALDELPEKYRIPFMLNKLEGLSYKEVAETLKLSVPNIETRIHRARKALQEILLKKLG
ncbi:MAG TPA: RNA polymerase sigma-70 factor [candidate division Zixibacteria bacterium]|nr:RNA polymerase sigma-70 factor [candidate division Zixibacteria bacterium]